MYYKTKLSTKHNGTSNCYVKQTLDGRPLTSDVLIRIRGELRLELNELVVLNTSRIRDCWVLPDDFPDTVSILITESRDGLYGGLILYDDYKESINRLWLKTMLEKEEARR